MKNYLIAICISGLATSVSAGSLGGVVGISYGNLTIAPGSDGYYNTNDDMFNRYEVTGSIGRLTESGLGWQVDALYEGAVGSAGAEYSIFGLTAHANYALGPVRLGAFVGGGGTDNPYLHYQSANFWYGAEAAVDLGDFSVAAQVGAGSADFGNASLDYNGKSFYQVEARYYIGETAQVAVHYGEGFGRLRNGDLSVTQYGVDATIRLGSDSRFYANLGYEHNFTNGNLNNFFRGDGSDDTYSVGISMMFGGGLQDTLRERTPMLSGNIMLLPGLNGGVWSD